MRNHALTSTNTNLWENNSHLETHLKNKLRADKECPIGPYDSLLALHLRIPPQYSHTVQQPCLPILKPAVREFPSSALLATKTTPLT